MTDLVGDPEDRFSHNEAHMSCCVTKSNDRALRQVMGFAFSEDSDQPGHPSSLHCLHVGALRAVMGFASSEDSDQPGHAPSLI